MTETIVRVVQSNTAPRAEFAYVDDSGDPGWNGSRTFGLGCMLVPLDEWTFRLDALIELRRGLARKYGLRVRDEVKGEWIAGVKQHFKTLGLGDGQLRDIYQQHLRLAPIIASGAFAIVMEKERVRNRDNDIEHYCWEYLFQRLRLRSEATGAPVLLIHDHGSKDKQIRSHWRHFRRYTLTPSGTRAEAPLLLEDPVPRDSQHSYFIQFADLVAYAATRRVVPNRGSKASICGPEMWDELGSARLVEVATNRTDGIVVWPRN